ncbi:outer membrane protein transport protein, partial [bacterium]|nr:outer membrane protein transport protein [bacterium]
KFKFGLTGKWESPIEYHGSFSETIYKFYNEGLSEILDGGKETTPKVDSQFSLKRPLSMGIGVAYQAHSDLVLSLDLSFTHWSVIDSLNLKTEDGDSVLKSLPLKWKNSLRICGGLDYRISNYSLRAGFFYEPHPPIPQYQNLFLPDMNDRVALNMGFAAYYDHFIIEISNEAEFFGKKDIAEYWEDGELKNVPGTYGGYITDLSLSLTYIF